MRSRLFAEYRQGRPDVSSHITPIESEVDPLGGEFDARIAAHAMITSISVVSRTLVHAPLVAVAPHRYPREGSRAAADG